MTWTCSSDRLPLLWKFSLRPTNSISFQPTPMPNRKRPPLSTSRLAALFGNQHCLTLREDQYLGGEFDLLRAGSDEAERHERIVEQAEPARTAAGGVRRVAAEHVVRQRQAVVTFGLGELGVFTHDRAIAADVAERQGYVRDAWSLPSLAGRRFPANP